MNIRKKLIQAGVKNLQEFGYKHVDESNLLTDFVYSSFFLTMLKENKGFSSKIDDEIEILVKEIKENKKKEDAK